MEIGKHLRELGLAKGMSATDLEARTGMRQDRIAAVEEGTETPTLDAPWGPGLERWASRCTNSS
jgi:transcriptional regulator with XRE-family HTH domain